MPCPNSCGQCQQCCFTPCSTILSISKFVSPTSVGPTGPLGTGFPSVTFVIFVRNIGPHPAYDVIVQDCLPLAMSLTSIPPNTSVSGTTLTTTLGTLEPGQLVTLIIAGTVLPTTPGTYTNQAVVTACNAATMASAASFSFGI